MKTTAKTRDAARRRHARAVAAGGYTREQVRRGEYPPLLTLLPRALANDVRAARIDGEALHTPAV